MTWPNTHKLEWLVLVPRVFSEKIAGGVHDKFSSGIGSLRAKHSNIVNGLAIPY
jgi:hypothetical protein